jgi:Hg(II)-responsive transcriptional regulator
MHDHVLRTRQVADAAGVNVETLRYYERRGILRGPRRDRSGYRQYAPDAVDLVRFVKHAQALGFTLDEVKDLLALRRPRAGRCDAVRHAAEEKVNQIDEKVRRLLAMRTALETLIASCRAIASALDCPLIESLTDMEEKRR